MPGLRPTKAFTGATLELATIGPGQRFGRLYHERYPDPLGFGKTKSRFSDPRRRPEDKRFGILYLGSTLKGCFVEAILRDRRNGAVGDYPIEEAELLRRRYAEIVVTSSLSMVDLRGDGRIYSSRLNEETNLAIYDRAISKLSRLLMAALLSCRYHS